MQIQKIHLIQKILNKQDIHWEIYKDTKSYTCNQNCFKRFVHWKLLLINSLICSMTDACITDPPSYPPFLTNQDTFPLSIMGPGFSDHSQIAPTVKQEEHLLREAVLNGHGLGTRVIAPAALAHTVEMPDTMVDSPMPEVRPEVESQVQPCISDLLSSPHMLPCKHGIFLYILSVYLSF